MPVSSLATGLSRVATLDFSPSEVDAAKKKLIELSNATVVVRSTKRDELGRIAYEEVPDSGIQLAATVKILEFAVGKPRQMMELTTGPNAAGKAMGARDLGRLLASEPDLVAKVLGALKDGLEQAQAIPVQAVASEIPGSKSES